jgi:SAM-dependent methyltransferase
MIDTPTVAPSNADQAAAWDGTEGAYWAENPQRFDDSVARHHRRLIAALDLAADSHALDVGCGNGQTTRDVARIVTAGSALGVDLSARMIDVARRTAAAEGLTNATFEQADAQVHPFSTAAFDVVLGRSVAMFFGDKPAAFANLARALRPGGQLALLVWREAARNEWFMSFRDALAAGRDLPLPPSHGPSPFSLTDPDTVRGLLGDAGFTDVTFESIDVPMYFGSDVEDTHAFLLGLLGWMLQGLDDAGQVQARAALRTTLDEHVSDKRVLFGSSSWLITARRA